MCCSVHLFKPVAAFRRSLTWRWRRCALAFLLVVSLGAVGTLGSSAAWGAQAGAASASGSAAENLTLQLKWLPQFQFAGYYAAQAKGFYQQEGLNVTIVPGSKDISPLATLLAGNAQFSVGDSDLLVARLQGQPIVAMAAVFQHSPYVILSRDDSNIRSPRDLVGKRVMMASTQGEIQLRAMLKRESIDPAQVKILPQSWSVDDLVARRVDAMSAYATVEPHQLLARGVAPATLRSSDFGVDFYGDILVTTEEQLAQQPVTSAAFLRASLKGWNYALKHPVEVADLILQVDGVARRGVTRDMLLREAEEMRTLILPDVVDIGHMSARRFQTMADMLISQGLAPSTGKLTGWLYAPPLHLSAQLMRGLSAAGAGFVLVVALVLVWNRQIQRRVAVKTRELQAEVSHRSAVQAQLRLSQELVQRLFGTAASGLVMNTPDGQLVMANPAYCAIVGYRLDELQGMDTRALTHPDDVARYSALRQNMLDGVVDTFTDEKRLVKKSGNPVWIQTTVSLVRAPDGSPIYVIAVMEDITRRRAMQAQLRQSEMQRDADRQKAQAHVVQLNTQLEARVRQRTAELETVNRELEAFSYSVSHDLRAPLTTIDGFAHLLGRAEADRMGDKGKQYLLRIRAAAKDMGELIDGLLALARVSSNPLVLAEVDLSAMADQVMQAAQEREPQRAVHVEIEGDLVVNGDRLLLATALQNLLGNAWKFTGKSPAAAISLSRHITATGEPVYCVKDNGAGFDMTTANRLFGTFERLHTSDEFAGTGVGLSIVKRVIERHGGRIWAEARVGHGAAFYFTLAPAATA